MGLSCIVWLNEFQCAMTFVKIRSTIKKTVGKLPTVFWFIYLFMPISRAMVKAAEVAAVMFLGDTQSPIMWNSGAQKFSATASS